MSQWLPILTWGKNYNKDLFAADGVAALIVTLMLIPQSLAYALLAGLPPESGLYASIAPLVAYAIMGTSPVLAIGPAALTSIMTATAVAGLSGIPPDQHASAAMVLALLTGAISLGMGALKLGFLAHFLSHPVLTGFVSASGLLIAASQMQHLLRLPLQGQTLPELAQSAWSQTALPHLPTLALGLVTLAMLWWARSRLKSVLVRLGLAGPSADRLAKAAPALLLMGLIAVSWAGNWESHGIRVVGDVPQGLPPWGPSRWSGVSWSWLEALWWPALLIALVGFIESVSVAQTLAARTRGRIEPDAELRALGAGNVAAGLTGGFPVTGGFSRTIVNHEAGARTPAAGLYTAVTLALATMWLTPLLHHLPKVALAATIVVAVLTLVDLKAFGRLWRYSRTDFAALALAFGWTLLGGIEAGLTVGIAVSLLLHVYRSSRPHIAVVGRVPETEHYRNVLRHSVVTHPSILGLRVDESLFFANARFLEDRIAAEVAQQPQVRHLVLQCNAINAVDASALESLLTINQRLREAGVQLHLSEVKGPVMDRLQRSELLSQLTGRVFLTHHQAVQTLLNEG